MKAAHTWVQARSTGRWVITSNRDGEVVRSLAVMDDFGNLIIIL